MYMYRYLYIYLDQCFPNWGARLPQGGRFRLLEGVG